MTPRRIALAIVESVWHKSAVPIFIERFLLPLFAAAVILLALSNPMGFDTTQRITGALALIFAAYFVAHTLHKWPARVAPPPPPKVEVEALPPNRPQLLIVKWGQIDEATFAAHDKATHIVQHGFFMRNFGLGETTIGVRVALTVPTEIPDVWTNGEGSTPTIVIGKDQVVFVPLWRKMGGFLIGHVLSRFDLRYFLMQTFQDKFGNKEIPVTIRYTSNGKRYVTTQNLIYSPEQRDIVGFGDPVQTLDTEPSQ
jgi:hypothetical protein